MTGAVPRWPVPGGVEVAVRATRRAPRAALGGIVDEADDDARLVARVTPPPEDSRVNVALVAMLAEVLGATPSACEIVASTGSRRKRVRVTGEAAELGHRPTTLSAGLGGRVRPA